MLEPAKFASAEDRVAAEVEMVEAELRRIDSRLRDLAWNSTVTTRRRTGNLSWADVSFDRASAERDADGDGDALVSAVLNSKRQALQHRLSELRLQLVGQGSEQRRVSWW